jgi:peptide-methionine (S)-S-oxide reductase
MARFPLRSVSGTAILVFAGAAVFAARPEHRRELTTRQDEGTPPPASVPAHPQENSTVNAQTHVTRHAPSIPPIDLTAPKKTETATFALGWFWTPDSQFGSIPGVVRTRVGYAGRKKKDPTYHDLGDHSETIEIDFDPEKITYAKMLDYFWGMHNPCRAAWSTQYKSAIFYHGEEQKKLALESRDRLAEKSGKVQTEIVPADHFYLAEDYHQKYGLRNSDEVMAEFHAMYPNDADFVNSTAAARVNSYLSGYGALSVLKSEIDTLGLSESAKQKLLQRVRRE